MKLNLFLLLTTLAGCEAVEDDLPGQLVHVEVSGGGDCLPARFTGDAGIQFFAAREDGGLVFTMSREAQFGPTREGALLGGVDRQVPSDAPTTVGNENTCFGKFNDWRRTDGGFVLNQAWPGVDFCVSGPTWLPTETCTTTRRFVFTEVGPCSLRCVRFPTGGSEVECRC